MVTRQYVAERQAQREVMAAATDVWWAVLVKVGKDAEQVVSKRRLPVADLAKRWQLVQRVAGQCRATAKTESIERVIIRHAIGADEAGDVLRPSVAHWKMKNPIPVILDRERIAAFLDYVRAVIEADPEP